MYEGIRAGDVFGLVLAARGFDMDLYTPTATERLRTGAVVNDVLREIYEEAKWPFLLCIEQRQYRPTWEVGRTYNAANEVYREAAYYVGLLDGNVGHAPEGGAPYWAGVGEEFLPVIEWRQPWEATWIDLAGVDVEAFAYVNNPRARPDEAPIKGCRLSDYGVTLPKADAPARPWVRFRPQCPEFDWTEWGAGEEYAAGEVRYRAGTRMCYVALRPNQGATPESSPEDWAQVWFPKVFRRYTVAAVRAQMMSIEDGRAAVQQEAEAERQRLRDVHLAGVGQAGRARWVK